MGGGGSLDRPFLIMARPEPSLFVEDVDVAEVVLKETAREPSVEKVVVSVILSHFLSQIRFTESKLVRLSLIHILTLPTILLV